MQSEGRCNKETDTGFNPKSDRISGKAEFSALVSLLCRKQGPDGEWEEAWELGWNIWIDSVENLESLSSPETSGTTERLSPPPPAF